MTRHPHALRLLRVAAAFGAACAAQPRTLWRREPGAAAADSAALAAWLAAQRADCPEELVVAYVRWPDPDTTRRRARTRELVESVACVRR